MNNTRFEIIPANITAENLVRYYKFGRVGWPVEFRRLARVIERQCKRKYYREKYTALGVYPIPNL
ncbi:hypothetical protein ELI15_14135 [Rhizobium ruizarguesonis]|uniref:hypothetical protein n=1 Tax=Rhizobium ruizarguesonis TaxID=2081791 RepID=UPI0010316097|nr:hypothetical protein [Rhizobium ruizarguesonis]TAW65429.1 hypothetical protein ELI15_14135 [Rhizobium ruizarguesonis]